MDSENKDNYSLKRRLWKKAAGVIDKARKHEPMRITELEKEYRDDILDILSNSDERVQGIFLKYSDEVRFINENAVGRGVSTGRGIRLNWKKDKTNIRGKYTTTFHEMGHCIDRAAGGLSYRTPYLKEALENDFQSLVNEFMKEYNVSQKEAYNMIGDALQEDKYHSISDIVGGLTENACIGKYGHSVSYWKEVDNAIEAEAFAHFYEAFARNDVEKIEALSQMFPTAEKEFMNLLERG
ncbi:MAG: hypothetical protein Q4E24_13985 [bacterium]|nr:hypothetical protein [bacterium]